MLSLVILTACSWNNPGHDPYMGQVADAVYSYADIPKNIQDKLHARMLKYDYDDIAKIGRETIEGAHSYSNLRQMHFGTNKRCDTIDRSNWTGKAERGLVYCEAQHCLIVPTVCRNVSRVTKVMSIPDHASKLEKKEKKVHTVPEPSTLALVLVAIFALRKKS